MIAPTFKARSASPAVWRPGATPTPPPQAVSSPLQDQVIPPAPPQPPPPPIWTPQASPQSSRKSYRPVHFESPVLPARGHNVNSTIERNGSSSALEPESRMKTSHSAPASGLNSLVSSSPGGNKLPKVQNPTVTLLQKGREGLLSRGASYLQEHDSDRLPRDRASPPKGDPIHALRREYASEGEEHIGRGPRKMPNEPRVEGIGPTTKDGMPVALRSEVKDQSRWYKRMYDTIHKNKYDDDYVTIRYKNRRDESQPRPSSRSQCAYFDPRSGYLSEPEGGMRRPGSSWSDAYDSDAAHAPRRRTTSVQGDRRNDDDVSSPYLPSTKYSTLASARARQEVYKNQPGRIENYVPGKSSVVDKESKMWWDEVMDIFDGELTNSNAPTQSTPGPKKNLTSSILSKSNMARALRETGYESDSQLVFRRHEETNGPLSPAERRAAYKDVQAGGEVPFRGLRSPAPPRQDDTELEYIPLSPTLTKIRVHKTPNYQEIICYPITTIELDRDKPKKRTPSFITVDLARNNVQSVPKPPKRISSRKPKTLNMIKLQKSNNKLNQPSTSISNVGILKEKINQKLTRQNTLILKKCNLLKKPSQLKPKSRSSSSINIEESKNSAIIKATSMSQTNLRKSDKCKLGQTRNILSPLQYTNPGLRKIHPSSSESEIIVGGAGRRTPVTNILDKVTSLDKLWSSDKRNQQVDKTKAKASLSKSRSHSNSKSNLLIQSSTSVHNLPKVTRGREIMRTADKIQKFKVFDHSILSQKISIATHNMNKQKKIPENSLVPNLSKECKKYKSLEALKSRSVNSHKQNLPSKNEKSLNSKSLKTGKRHLKGYDKHQSSNKNIKKNMEDVSRFPLSAEEIKETRDSIISDSFFQHLLFKNYPYLVCPLEFESDVLRKAKVFESFHHHNCYSKPANTLLINRKPVTTSKFKINDQYKSNKYCSRSISCPSKFQEDSRKLFYSRYGSTSSLGSLRSRSEPRVDRFYFSQTSRPKFPVINYALKKRIITNSERTSSPTKIISSETSRPISSHTRYVKQNNEQMHLDRSLSVSPTRIILTETIRPISPVVTKNYKSECVKNIKYRSQESLRSDSPFYYHDYSRSHSSSPVPPRSPSYRRINSTRKKISGVVRTKSAGDAETNMPLNYQCNKSYSETNICNNELLCQSRKERFRELSKYYNYLERVGELEKKTSSCDLRHRKKNEEIIDFDRWRKVRSIERAETELRNLQSFLRKAQIEKDVLFYPRDVNELRWSYERDHGLKMKEKSVEDLREHFQAHPCTSSVMSNCSTNDFYKPLWRGKSVIESAFSIDRNIYDKPKDYIQKYSFEDHLHSQSSDLQNEIGLGNNIWSSLSSEQINVLKNQLNEIFGKDMKKNNEEFSIDVSNAKVKSSNVYVRSNSLISLPEPQKTTISKSGSIAFIPTTSTTNNKLCKKTTALSESEKIKMSQALSKEVLNKIKTNSNVSLESLETNAIKNTDRSIKITEIPKINKKHSTELSQSDPNNDHRVSYSEGIISHPSSASETETASSDISNKTVIHNEPNNKVLKKVAYFESAKKEENATTIYLPRDEEDRHTPENRACLVPYKNLDSPRPLSQSCSDLSELFGESEKSKFLSLPPNRNRLSRSRSPGSEIYVNSRRTLNTLLHPSEEAIFRSRSPSPRVERYWQAYLNLAKAGEVRRLARKFESSWPIRRHCSDSDLTCDILSAGGKLHYHKQRDKLGPVTRVPLRACNRLMPHIDIISKLASLRRRTFDSKYKSPDEYIECRRGEVDRIRRRFEVMSMFGQIYSSAPDVSQLKDIAPYLSGSWIAHRYPKISDNYKNIDNKNKSLKNNNHKESNPVKLNSILHNEKTIVTYNPEIHKPSHRYEPPRNPPRPPPAAWSSWIEPFISSRRNMVKFKESPRRYVESDVNIHYKCPVRRDPLPHVPERELARQQAEHMKRLYREQKRTKYLQDLDINPDDIEAFDASIKELQDMQNRRHQDNFTPSQKTVVPLNRYDDAEKTVAKALYNFTGNTPRELSFKKGDFITVRRQYDENWYEGELHGRIGLFPYTFVEIQRGEGMNVSAPISQQPSTQPTILEGRARALYNFKGQTVLELPMKQGEIVVLRKRVDHNWWEGRNGKKTGIIPNNYIEVLQEPTQITNNGVQNHSSINVDKPLASPASHGLVGATARSSMGSHSYTPQLNSPNLANGPQATQPLPSYKAKPAHASLTPSERGYGPPTTPGVNLNNTEPLYIDTNAKAVPFRVLYPYQPQHSDEMELAEGDTVYVLEVCDDGWCVGSSQRTGRFGTFPGNYVERI